MGDERAIVNTWDQLVAAGGGVAVSYHPANDRACMVASWTVFRVAADRREFVTDPKAHWTDNGRKAFHCCGREDKARAEREALAWASERFGVTEWARNRMRDWVPAEVQKAFPIPARKPLPGRTP